MLVLKCFGSIKKWADYYFLSVVSDKYTCRITVLHEVETLWLQDLALLQMAEQPCDTLGSFLGFNLIWMYSVKPVLLNMLIFFFFASIMFEETSSSSFKIIVLSYIIGINTGLTEWQVNTIWVNTICKLFEHWVVWNIWVRK